MKFNNVIDTLRCWCTNMTAQYSAEYDDERNRKGMSLRFFRYLVTIELQYKLSMLLDQEFEDFQHFLRTVHKQVHTHFDSSLLRPLDKEESYHVDIAESAFMDYLKTVPPDCSRPDIPYVRNIIGKEAESIISRFQTVWGYDPIKYWYPLSGAFDESKLFIMVRYIEGHFNEICQLIGIPGTHIYEHGENWYPGVPACAEVEEIIGYGGCEVAYTDKDFRWVIYFSHEDTVTFAGSIIPQVKQILMGEMEHWNRWEDC